MKGKTKILIVDDDPLLAKTVVSYLNQVGTFKAKSETNPVKALKACRRFKPDLILLDIMMPEKDGFSVLEDLKDTFPISEIPVIMVTALDTDEAKMQSLELYSEAFITKPFSMGSLLKTIEKTLEQYGTRPSFSSFLSLPFKR